MKRCTDVISKASYVLLEGSIGPQFEPVVLCKSCSRSQGWQAISTKDIQLHEGYVNAAATVTSHISWVCQKYWQQLTRYQSGLVGAHGKGPLFGL